MKILFTIIFLTYLLTSVSYGQVKIGLPAGGPQASAVLDLSNMGDGTRGVALPRVANIASIVTPVNGLLIYDLSSNCLKVYQNGAWSACIGSSASGADVNCASSAINGNYNQGTALTAANTVTIVVINNTSSALKITPSISDITLGGAAAAGMSVASVSPASVSPAASGGASTITYTLSGNPTTTGSFTATWAIMGFTCAKTGNVCLAILPITVTNTTTPATLPIPTAVGNSIDFTAAGGTPNTTGLTWAMTSNPSAGVFSSPATGTGATAQAILIANASGLVTVTYSAVNACGLTVTGTKAVSVSELSVNNTTSTINSFYSQNTALTAANTVTIVLVNNSNVIKTVTPLTADLVLSGAGAAGIIVASFSPASVPVAANGGTSTITYTLSGTPTTVGSFTATFTKSYLSWVKTGAVCLAIAPITVTNTTTPATLPIPTTVGNTIDFTAAGGTPNTGLTWAMTSNPATGVFSSPTTGTGATAQAILMANAIGLVTVTYSAVNACGLTVTGTQAVSVNELSVNNTASAINGYYSQNTPLTAANTVTIVLVNSSTVARSITPSTADLVLSGTGAAGMSVASFSPATVSVPANGGTSTITYTLGGTPTTVTSFTATWSKFGLSAAKSSAVCLAITPITVTNTTTPSPLILPVVAGNTINFTATGGTPNSTGITWTMSSSPAGMFSNPASGAGSTPQAILVAGATGTVTVTFTVTNTCGLVVTGTGTAGVYNDNIRAALSAAGCASCVAYDAAAVNDYVQITVAEYDKFETVISGLTNYGMKYGDRTLGAGHAGWTSYMLTNNIPTTAIPFAFSTKLDGGGNACVKLITQSSNTLTGPAETSWGSATGISLGAATTVGTYYFVIKKPTIFMPANTNIAVHGYNDGWGNGGGSGLDGVTSSNVSSGTANSETDCVLKIASATALAPAGISPAAYYLNYDIKWTSTRQW